MRSSCVLRGSLLVDCEWIKYKPIFDQASGYMRRAEQLKILWQFTRRRHRAWQKFSKFEHSSKLLFTSVHLEEKGNQKLCRLGSLLFYVALIRCLDPWRGQTILYCVYALLKKPFKNGRLIIKYPNKPLQKIWVVNCTSTSIRD